MAEVLLRFERPPSVTAELRAWLHQRARAGQAALALSRAEGSRRGELLLRVEIPSESPETAEAQLADLMLDMQLMGLRPAVMPAAVAPVAVQPPAALPAAVQSPAVLPARRQ